MDKQSRRDAVRQYKEATPTVGVFAVRRTASGEAWVGRSQTLDQQQNGVWFMLRHGGHPNRAVQAAWNSHGEAAFAFEPLETVEAAELTPLGVRDWLKAAEQRWREKLSAGKLVG